MASARTAPHASRAQRRAFLESVDLFAGLAPSMLDRLVELSATRSLEAGEVLCHKGDAAGQLYGVLSGRLKVVGSSSEGREVVFVVMGPGEVTGEIALIDGRPRSATIVAIEPSELVVISRRDFLAFLRENRDAAIQLCLVLAGYVRRLSDTVEDAYYHKLPVRLAKKLLVLAREHGQETPEGLRIGVKLSQRELGELVGKTREAVNKQLRSWTDAGWIATVDGHLVIRDLERIEVLADGL
jgi:CRP-like cAMP-binding protein